MRCLALLLVLGTVAGAADISYTRDIKPILADSCYECHGPTKAKAGLRLDTPEGIRKGTKKKAVLVAGDPAKSLLYTVTVLPKDDDDFMPANGEPLKKAQTELLKAWIAAGASFDDGAAPVKQDKSSAITPAPAVEAPALPPAHQPVRDPAKEPRLAALVGAGMVVEGDDPGWAVNAAHLPKGITEEHLKLLAAAGPLISDLNLAGSGITDKQVRQLAACTGLVHLNLARNPDLGDAAIRELAGQPAAKTLRTLNLYATGVSDAATDALGKLGELDDLYVWQTKITPAALERLHRVMPTCEIVSAPSDLPSQPLAKGPRKKKKA